MKPGRKKYNYHPGQKKKKTGKDAGKETLIHSSEI